MKYIALLRGINVGGHKRVEMPKLKRLLESLDYVNVTTYLNSGNAIFESEDNKETVQIAVDKILKSEFEFDIPTLIKTHEEIKHIADQIPENWQNNKEQKTDIAYLFPSVDTKDTLEQLPIKLEYANIIYVQGAIIWHIMKKDLNKSQLNKLVGRKLYQQMTVRNVNTARFLAADNT